VAYVVELDCPLYRLGNSLHMPQYAGQQRSPDVHYQRLCLPLYGAISNVRNIIIMIIQGSGVKST